MKIHRVRFRESDRDKFNEVLNGLKTIETRAATVKFRDIAVGDQLNFVCGKDSLLKSINAVKHYASIDELLDEMPLKHVLPSVKNRQEAYEVYWSFPNYKQKIEEHGIMAFDLR